MNTRDIGELYKEFQSELKVACSSFYAWKNIHNIAAKDDKIYHALNKNSYRGTLFYTHFKVLFLLLSVDFLI